MTEPATEETMYAAGRQKARVKENKDMRATPPLAYPRGTKSMYFE